MSLLGARVSALFALFGLTMIAGLGPVIVFIFWRQRQEKVSTLNELDEPLGGGGKQSHGGSGGGSGKSAKTLQLLLVFGGGVLLSTCFVHMIPEIQENYQNYWNNQHNQVTSTTPPTKISASDRDNLDHHYRYNENGSRGSIDHHHDGYRVGHNVHHDGGGGGGSEGKSDKTPWVEICICLGLFVTYFIEEAILLLIGHSAHHHSHHHHEHHEIIGCLPEGSGSSGDYGTLIRPVNSSKKTSEDLTSIGESRRRLSSNDTLTKSVYDTVAVVDIRRDDSPTFDHINGHYNPEKIESQWTRFARGLIIVVAFLAHSIFDGVAIGLQTSVNSLWTMFFAICLHKLVVVFAIGFELYEKTCSFGLTTIHITLFSSMSPLGIILAILTERGLSEDGSLTLILLNAAATGAILYIVFLEILQHDRCPELNGLIQLTALILGFTLMTVVTLKVSDGD